MKEIKAKNKWEMWNSYQELERLYAGEQNFYYDMAGYFFEKKMEKEATKILYEAAERMGNFIPGKKIIAYLLEQWKKFGDAINIYKDIVDDKPSDLQTKRELALAYFQNEQYQLALDTYYSIICSIEQYNYYTFNYNSATPEQQIKSAAMDEMNALVAMHGQALDISRVNANLIRPIPVDLRISVEGNFDIDNMQIVEPGGKVCSDYQHYTESGGCFMNNESTYGRTYSQYMIKNAAKGFYRIKLAVYNYGNGRAPKVARILIFKNFQRVNQTLEIKNVILDEQFGTVEIAETKW